MSRPKGSKNRDKLDFKTLEKFVAANGFKEAEDSLSGEIIPKYKATLKILGKTYTSEGATVDEVLDGFKTQSWIKGAGVLIVEKDGVKKEKIIAGNHIRNVFGMASGTMRAVSLKWIKQLF